MKYIPGFDDQGRQFDLNGNLVDWWATQTKEKYLERAKCIIEQYGNYSEPSTKLKVINLSFKWNIMDQHAESNDVFVV